MSDGWVTYIGYVAACLTTGCFVPQVVQAIKAKDLRSISLTMYVMFVSGIGCWLAYGIALGSGPIMAANGLTLLLSSTVLYLKLRDDRRRRNAQPPSPRGVQK